MGLIFDGIDLKANYNFVVTSINGRGSPPVSRTTLELPRIDGAIELNSKLQSRNVTIRGYVYGTDASTKKDALIKLITQAYSQEKKLTFPDTNRSIYVKLAGEPIVLGPVGPVLNAQAYELTFNFVAQDPYFYADEHNESGFRIVKVNAHAPTYLISPRRKFLKREASLKIEPYTIINLLGKYGDFETDSNDDSIADIWKNSLLDEYSLETNAIFGNKSQRILKNPYTNTSGSDNYVQIYSEIFPVIDQHYYFIASYAKLVQGSSALVNYCDITGGSTPQWAVAAKSIISSNWERYYSTFQVLNGNNSISIKFQLAKVIDGQSLDETRELYVDGVMLVDLTAMGTLPYGLQQYFAPSGITQWEDLATTSNIEALDGRVQSGEDWLAELLPYVSGIATLGFAWEGI